MNRSQKGFTLIELMIVVAIIAILVSLAVPAYRDYIIRAKVSECIAMSAAAKTSISEYWSSFAFWPPSITAAGISSVGGNVSEFCTVFSYNDDQGDFKIDIDSATVGVAGSVIRPFYSPTLAPGGNINWSCTFGDTSNNALKFLPSNCRADNITSF